jgi:hypothetical protein
MILGIPPGESYSGIRVLADLSVCVNLYQQLCQEASNGSPCRLAVETYGCHAGCMCVGTLVLTMAHHTIMTYREDPMSLHPWHGSYVDDYIMAGIRKHALVMMSAS